MKHLSAVLALTVAAPLAQTQAAPSDLVRLATQARLDSPVSWCRGVLRAGHSGGYAAAIQTRKGGRYMVLEPRAPAVELGPFFGTPSLACYTPAAARKLSVVIGHSETIKGSISPRWTTTVVCAFADATTSTCWQYSPVDRRFVAVGGWTT